MSGALPHSPQAEASVIGQVLAHPRSMSEIVQTLLEAQHFHDPSLRALFFEIQRAYYDDDEDSINALSIGERCAKTLSRNWSCAEGEAVDRVRALAARGARSRAVVEHAKLVKRDADYRALLDLAQGLTADVGLERDTPEELAGWVAQRATEIVTSTLLTHEVISWDELGRRFIAHQEMLRRAQASGVEVGVYFGMSFLDHWLRGLRPTELFILGGEPGMGKSAVAWEASRKFAERQLKKPANRRIGTLVMSLEMGEEPSSNRVASGLAGIDGGRIREGKTDDDDMRKIARRWGDLKGLPLHFNFTSTLRASQLRAVIVQELRRGHNIGLVVIDHMRYFDMDGQWPNKLEEEEAKARFLKENVAKELNVAVMCLAHTTKGMGDDGRPRLKDLRGSYMVAAHADFVGFVYRPHEYATEQQLIDGTVKQTDAELLWGKNRHGLKRPARFHFDPSTMDIH